MSTLESLKGELLRLIDSAEPEVGLSEEAFARLDELVTQMSALSVYPEPIRTPERVEGRWETTFAHFGGRHSAAKTRVHMSTLRVQSFNRFPALPIRVTRIFQEVAVADSAYNNLIALEAPDGSASGHLIVRGRYREDPDHDPKRFAIEFHHTDLMPAPAVTPEALRAALGIEAGAPLSHALKAAKLYSDIVYLDDEIRINRGGLGGLYVLRRVNEPGLSIPLAPRH